MIASKSDSNRIQKKNFLSNESGIYSTPVLNKFPIKQFDSSANRITDSSHRPQRRAFGDLINTATSNQQRNSAIGLTPAGKAVCGKELAYQPKTPLFSKVDKPTSFSVLNEKRFSDEEKNYEPIESCHKQIDRFDDLFDQERISEMLINAPLANKPKMATGEVRFGEDAFRVPNIPCDSEWDSFLRNLRKSAKKKYRQTESSTSSYLHACREIPSIDDLAFKIFTDI
jgi:hypothetical protein